MLETAFFFVIKQSFRTGPSHFVTNLNYTPGDLKRCQCLQDVSSHCRSAVAELKLPMPSSLALHSSDCDLRATWQLILEAAQLNPGAHIPHTPSLRVCPGARNLLRLWTKPVQSISHARTSAFLSTITLSAAPCGLLVAVSGKI
jgi:hypothetical protein